MSISKRWRPAARAVAQLMVFTLLLPALSLLPMPLPWSAAAITFSCTGRVPHPPRCSMPFARALIWPTCGCTICIRPVPHLLPMRGARQHPPHYRNLAAQMIEKNRPDVRRQQREETERQPAMPALGGDSLLDR